MKTLTVPTLQDDRTNGERLGGVPCGEGENQEKMGSGDHRARGEGKDRRLHEPHSMEVLGILDQEVPEWLWAATSMRGKKCGVESLSGGFFAWIAERLGRRWPK